MSDVRLYAMTCGWLTGHKALFLPGAEGRLRVPVPSYLIEHPKGRVIFDTGMHVRAQTDPGGALGRSASQRVGCNAAHPGILVLQIAERGLEGQLTEGVGKHLWDSLLALT